MFPVYLNSVEKMQHLTISNSLLKKPLKDISESEYYKRYWIYVIR